MSQSDYLKHKKTAHILKEDKLPPVLSGSDYASYKRYQIVNTVENDETNYGELVPQGKKKIFGMELSVTNCPSFILCQNTNTRNNRVPVPTIYSDCKPLITSESYFPDRFSSCNCNKIYSKYTDQNGLDKTKAPNLQCCRKARLRMQLI